MVLTQRLVLRSASLATLLAAALFLPLPLYLVSLALFGLPHVIWEMGFLRSRYAARWPVYWWVMLWAVLLVQAGVRGAVWLGAYPATSSAIIDLLTLFLLGVVVTLAPQGAGWLVRIGGGLMASLVFWLLQHEDITAALLILALAHNFTPLGLVWDMARTDRATRPLAWFVTGLCALPVLVAISGWHGATEPTVLANQASLLDGQVPAAWSGSSRQAWLCAAVLAQCLHYYCIIVLLPQAEAKRTARAVISPAVRFGTVAIVVLMLMYYGYDYAAARKLYAVAAGVHAWLEWPLLLMAFLCIGRRVNRARDEGNPTEAGLTNQA